MKIIKKILFLVILCLSFFITGCNIDNLGDEDLSNLFLDNEINNSVNLNETSLINDEILINQTNETEILNKEDSKIFIAEFSRLNTPVAKFTKQDIDLLGIDCSGSDEEIAECIFNWQKENMIYIPNAPLNEGPFLPSYELRWQELVPGIYNSRDVLENHISASGKLYGVCFEFSIVYCSIAEYYGLDCRILQSYININGEDRPGGMSFGEYEVFKPWLDKAGLKYDYDAVSLAMPEDSQIPGHYWAEVKLKSSSDFDNGEWRVVDASNKINDGRLRTLNHIKNDNEWEVVNWSKKDRTKILEELQRRIDSGEDIGRQNEEGMSDLDTFLEGRDIYADDVKAGRENVYVGITDELGNTNRAANIDDFMQGKALAPYFASCEDSCDFIMGGDQCKKDCVRLDEEPARCYDKCSGEKFYIVCDYICEDASDSKWPSCYQSCSGNSLDISCDNKCWDD